MSGVKKSIPYGDYLTIRGLLSLADRHNKSLRDIVQQLEAITGEGNDPEVAGLGHCADQAWATNPDADDLLSRLEILVEGKQPAKETTP